VGVLCQEILILKIKVIINSDGIRKTMFRRNMRQCDVAENIGTSEFYFSQMVTHRRDPSPDMRKRIQIFFRGASWDNLFQIKEYTNGSKEVS